MLIFNTQILKIKKIYISLKSIYGLHFFVIKKILKKLGFSNNLIILKMKQYQINNLISLLNYLNHILSFSLKKIIKLKLVNMIKIKSVKGLRLLRNLPIRGQRTKTNAKTAKKLAFKFNNYV